MRDEICVQCKQVIPAGACQQGQLIEDVWYPLHVGCAEAWCSQPIPVWTVGFYGAGYTEGEIENLTSMLESMEDGTEYSIEKRTMPRLEYLKLPEFTGF